MTQDGEWGEDLKMPTMSSLARAMETQKDDQKIGKMRCREEEEERGPVEGGKEKRKIMEQWKTGRNKGATGGKKQSWRKKKESRLL